MFFPISWTIKQNKYTPGRSSGHQRREMEIVLHHAKHLEQIPAPRGTLICLFLVFFRKLFCQESLFVVTRSIFYLLLHHRRTESSKVTPSRQTIWQNLCQAKWWSDPMPRSATRVHTQHCGGAPPNSEQSHSGLIVRVRARAMPKLSRTGNMLRTNHSPRPAVNASLDPSHARRGLIEVSGHVHNSGDAHETHTHSKIHKILYLKHISHSVDF